MREGGDASFLFLKGEGGRGWRRLREALREYSQEGRNDEGTRGESQLRPMVEELQPYTRSYREVLMQAAVHHEIRVGHGGGKSATGYSTRNMH